MKKITILILLVSAALFAISCQQAATAGNGPHVTKTPAPVPPAYQASITQAWYLRQATGSKNLARTIEPGSIAAQDPLIDECTETGTVYIFWDNGSLIQYIPDGVRGYTQFKSAAASTTEVWNRDNPTTPIDYVAVDPPGTPIPVYANDPTPAAGEFLEVLADGTVVFTYQATDAADYARVKALMPDHLEMYNRDHDPDAHLLYGAPL